jgi:predicted ABC-type ATPase
MVSPPNPSIIILAGPNGAGKTTLAGTLLVRLSVTEFVNADEIAQQLSPGAPEHVAIEAGRRMLERMNELVQERKSFAFETTLAARIYHRWLRDRLAEGYAIDLSFCWLPNAQMAVDRVARRVTRGGHDIPEDVIRRRYALGVRNLFSLYLPLATTWDVYDTSVTPAQLIASGKPGEVKVVAPGAWDAIVQQGTANDAHTK